jgi:hypothetical protein
MSMESKVNIYIYLSILIIVLMVISIFIQILLMKRIFYFHRDFLEVGENDNRVSKDPIGISQPIIPDNSNDKEQPYIALKEHKEVPEEEKPVINNDKKLFESQAKGEQEAIALKLNEPSNLKTNSASTKQVNNKTHANDGNLKITHKSGIYSQNSPTKKNAKPVQYSTIVLDQKSSASKKEKKHKKENPQLSEDIKTVVDQKTEVVDQPGIVSELHEDSLSKVDASETNSSIENFVKKDLEQQVENNQVTLEVDSTEATTNQDNLTVVHPIDKIEDSIILVDTQKDTDELSIKEKISINTPNDTAALSLSGGLNVLEVETIKPEVVEGQNLTALQIKANDVLDVTENDIQVLIGLENILRTDNIITNDSDAEFELTLPKQIEENKPEQQPLEKESFKKSNEQSLAIEEVSINQVADVLAEAEVVESVDQVDTQALLNVEDANNTDEIIFFSGINSDFVQQAKHDPLNDILTLEKGILQSLGAKQESKDSESNGIVKNKTNKLKLFDNVVKKLTTPVSEEVDVEITKDQINSVGHEISMDGIRDTYQRILNSYK